MGLSTFTSQEFAFFLQGIWLIGHVHNMFFPSIHTPHFCDQFFLYPNMLCLYRIKKYLCSVALGICYYKAMANPGHFTDMLYTFVSG
jgi:hypothetical protein